MPEAVATTLTRFPHVMGVCARDCASNSSTRLNEKPNARKLGVGTTRRRARWVPEQASGYRLRASGAPGLGFGLHRLRASGFGLRASAYCLPKPEVCSLEPAVEPEARSPEPRLR